MPVTKRLPHLQSSVHVCSAASVMSDSLRPYGLQPTSLFCPSDSPVKNTRAGCHALLQGIFPTQGQNPHLLCLLHCRWILYPLSRLGSPQSSEPSSKDTLFVGTYLISFSAVLPVLPCFSTAFSSHCDIGLTGPISFSPTLSLFIPIRKTLSSFDPYSNDMVLDSFH